MAQCERLQRAARTEENFTEAARRPAAKR